MGLSSARAGDEAAARLAASVASYALDISVDEIIGDERGSLDIAFARQVAIYLCHVGFEMSLTRVAYAFARDRSTVAHACHAIEDRRDEPAFEIWMSGLESMLHQAPSPTKRLLPKKVGG